jgi:Domain of unknown function (DUF3303)
MALFVAKHQHSAETCPAGNPEIAPMLAQHVSRDNARNFGLDLQGEAVVDGGHTLYLIVGAPDRASVEEFMGPFQHFGMVEVLPASSCEQVVARAAC